MEDEIYFNILIDNNIITEINYYSFEKIISLSDNELLKNEFIYFNNNINTLFSYNNNNLISNNINYDDDEDDIFSNYVYFNEKIEKKFLYLFLLTSILIFIHFLTYVFHSCFKLGNIYTIALLIYIVHNYLLCFFYFQKIFFLEKFLKLNFYCDLIEIVLFVLFVLIILLFFILKSLSNDFSLFYNEYFYLSLFLLITGMGINNIIIFYEFCYIPNNHEGFQILKINDK
jgi:amino acid transporter